MNDVFPLGFPPPTAFYLLLYVLTFAAHQVLMHYVLAGSAYVAWARAWPSRGEQPPHEQPLARILSDWMPFMLSAAITAGVAPLLFVQIIYPQHFYTANVLLAWRWMMVIPVLIVAFYLLYVVKSVSRSRSVRAIAPTVAAVCFVFVGFCWTANYFVTTNEGGWSEMYLHATLPFEIGQLLWRMAIWFAGSFATMAAIVAWQLNGRRICSDVALTENAFVQLTWMAVVGLVVASTAAVAHLFMWPAAKWDSVRTLGLPYLLAAALGAIVQMVLWWMRPRSLPVSRIWLTTLTAAMALTVASVSVVREAMRVSNLDLSTMYAHHKESGAIGGLALFLVFAVVNGLLIALCVWIVKHAAQRGT